MDLQFNVESEPRYTLAATVNRCASNTRRPYRLVVVNPMICKYMLSPPIIAATKVSTVGQYMFEQADHRIHRLGCLECAVSLQSSVRR